MRIDFDKNMVAEQHHHNRTQPYYRSTKNNTATITFDDLADMSKLTLTRMRAFIKKNTNIVGVNRYDRARLERILPRAVKEAETKKRAAELKNAAAAAACDVVETPRTFVIEVNRMLVDCSRTRSKAIAALEKRYTKMVVCSSKVNIPETTCRVCKKFMESWRSVTFGACGHSVVCASCDEDSNEKKCPQCKQVIMYTFAFKPCVPLVAGFQ
ncbi:Unknown (Se84) [Spodoptera exigua multiple nucleopolyhedrovirus]|nr:Unknown (Se84) [Spodoptera exigua multiple nucleopolyhedrovirus]